MEAEAWRDALLESRNHFQKTGEEYLRFLETGCTAYKYNYSNSKRMRRHFWIDEARVELCWGKSRSDEPQNMDLRDCVGIIYGPMTTTFQRSNALEDPPWCCFSLLFPDRTLDLAVPNEHIQKWFLGLQHLLLTRSSVCISTLSEPQFVFRKVFHKLRDSAHRQGFTTRALLVRNLHNLGRDRGFREALTQQANGTAKAGSATTKAGSSSADAEAEAKAERRRRRRESKAMENGRGDETGGSVSASPPPPGKDKKKSSAGLDRRKGSAEAGGSNGSAVLAAEQQEEELRRLITQLEGKLETQTSQLEALRPKWNAQLGSVLPMDSLQEVLRSEDSLQWQFEKCAELEHEVLTLQGTNNSMAGHLHAAEKAEKQLKKLAKQFKDSEAQCASMEQELGSAQAGAQNSEKAKLNSSAAVERAEAQTSHLDKRVRELEQQLSEASKGQELSSMFQAKNKQQAEELAKIENDKAGIKQKMDALAKDHKAVDKRHQENQQRLVASQGLSQNLLKALHKMQEDVKALQGTHKVQVRSEADSQLRAIADSMRPLKGAVEKIGAQHEHLVERHREIMGEIKKLHNQVLELKGNIRVFVRVRPMNDKERGTEPANGEVTIGFAEEMKMSVYAEEQARRKWFDFDRVFRQNSSQQEVFEEVKPLATSVLDGYNVCIFAYGQTGSGKTFTMTGIPANPGLNVRVLKELFRIRTERVVSVDCRMSISVTEIYNEQIKDLLGGQKSKKLDVKQNSDGTNTVPGLTEIQVESVEEVLKTMETAAANRTVMSTDMNDESSRSHSIVQVKTVCIHHKDKSTYAGKINLIDLAGSENTNKSGVQGQGMKEAQNINKSLSALGDVISSLVSKSGHIPYRNSKLTMMLKDSLGGDSKTLMIVQCSPAQPNVTETLSSLNFASRARNVELGKAKKNVSKAD
mmetsp:Transcript_81053/g.147924  ORF Transcript_81053/g.147924 Transcript_81053/m.147924 type:complete len:920 (-) Transcript_81053:65-2824(-)